MSIREGQYIGIVPRGVTVSAASKTSSSSVPLGASTLDASLSAFTVRVA